MYFLNICWKTGEWSFLSLIKYFPVKVWKLCPRGLIHILYFSCGLIFLGMGFVSWMAGMWRSGTAGVSVGAVTLIWVSKWSNAGSTVLSSGHPIDSSECHWSQFCHFLVALCVLVMLRRHLEPKGGSYWTAQILGTGAWCFQCRWAAGFVWGSCTKPSLGAWDVAFNIVEKPAPFLIILTCSLSTLVPDERSIASETPLTRRLLPVIS